MKLPISDLIWMDEKDVKKFNIHKIDLEGDFGYILECDLDYPKKLHLLHQNLPLAPEVLEVSEKNLSQYALQALLDSDKQTKYKDVKLLSTFYPRKNYILHGKNLKLYLDLGMELKKIHRIMSFKQKAFIAPFIEKCTNARKTSTTKFSMDLYKKLANCVYGKTLQDVRSYSCVKLHLEEDSTLKAVSDPTFKHHSIIDDNLVQTNHFNLFVLHDKPIFIGFTILELVLLFYFLLYNIFS